jgi:hypothetical protein
MRYLLLADGRSAVNYLTRMDRVTLAQNIHKQYTSIVFLLLFFFLFVYEAGQRHELICGRKGVFRTLHRKSSF